MEGVRKRKAEDLKTVDPPDSLSVGSAANSFTCNQFISLITWDEIALYIRARSSCIKRITVIELKF